MHTPVENSATHDLAWFRDNVSLWAGDGPFVNELIRQAIIRFQEKLAALSDRTGLTVDVSPPFTVFDNDDCPEQFAADFSDFDPLDPDSWPVTTWKWDHSDEGWGDIAEVHFGSPNTDEIPYDMRKKGMIISTRDNVFYLIPAALVPADNV